MMFFKIVFVWVVITYAFGHLDQRRKFQFGTAPADSEISLKDEIRSKVVHNQDSTPDFFAYGNDISEDDHVPKKVVKDLDKAIMLRKLITSLKKQDVMDATDASARDISASLFGNDASKNNRIPEKLAKAIAVGEVLSSLKKQDSSNTINVSLKDKKDPLFGKFMRKLNKYAGVVHMLGNHGGDGGDGGDGEYEPYGGYGGYGRRRYRRGRRYRGRKRRSSRRRRGGRW